MIDNIKKGNFLFERSYQNFFSSIYWRKKSQ